MRADKHCTYKHIYLHNYPLRKMKQRWLNVCKQVYDRHHNNNNTTVNSDTGNRIRKVLITRCWDLNLWRCKNGPEIALCVAMEPWMQRYIFRTKNLPVILKAHFKWTSNLTKVSVRFEYCHYLNNMWNVKMSQNFFLMGPNDKLQKWILSSRLKRTALTFRAGPGWFMLVTSLVLV